MEVTVLTELIDVNEWYLNTTSSHSYTILSPISAKPETSSPNSVILTNMTKPL